jgi:hypothetical protein
MQYFGDQEGKWLFWQVKFILQLKKSSEAGEKYLGHKQENPVP